MLLEMSKHVRGTCAGTGEGAISAREEHYCGLFFFFSIVMDSPEILFQYLNVSNNFFFAGKLNVSKGARVTSQVSGKILGPVFIVLAVIY